MDKDNYVRLSTGLTVTAIPALTLNESQHKNMLSWIEALESGKYQQGPSALRNEDGTYCCLGVAVAVHPDTTEESWVKKVTMVGGTSETNYRFHTNDDGQGAHLPMFMKDFLGVPNEWGLYVKATDDPDSQYAEAYSLASLNDDFAATFEDIAKILKIAINGGLNTEIKISQT